MTTRWRKIVFTLIKGWFRKQMQNAESDSWPFDQPRNCAAVTMRQVLKKEEPILLVSHDADDHGWQFIGSSDASVADGKLVCLKNIVEMDPSVLEVADLPPGWQAVRSSPNEPWQRRIRPADHDE